MFLFLLSCWCTFRFPPLTHTLSRFSLVSTSRFPRYFVQTVLFLFPLKFFSQFRCFPSLFLFPLPSLSLVFSFSISHREDRFHASRKTPPRGPRLFLPPKKGRVQPGRLYQVSSLSRECRVKTELENKKQHATQPALPGRKPSQKGGTPPASEINKQKKKKHKKQAPGSGRSIFNELLFVSA